jgi:acyl-coenzyme A synthetase/AMP-(fatty) acid ligase
VALAPAAWGGHLHWAYLARCKIDGGVAGVEGTEDLKAEIQQMVRQRLSTHSYPREIDFVTALPKTPSGKIQRFILRGDAR